MTQTTREKIIDATLHLIQEKGYKAATTKLIAEEAGVREITIFRHFGNKMGIMDEAFTYLLVSPISERFFEIEPIWDLEKDLTQYVNRYNQILNKNRDFILISFKEMGTFPKLDQLITSIPREIKDRLIDYFTEMHRQGKVIETNFEAVVLNLLWLLFGTFLSRTRFENQITSLSEEDLYQNSILLFTRGLTP
ncbi:MAG TPA: TetR/AcrR family transcriptional regulator [Paenibacillaceae bacterium]|nr:TetR/AcrR family transcriptional regulator [Paenibacillaceae bacterium]